MRLGVPERVSWATMAWAQSPQRRSVAAGASLKVSSTIRARYQEASLSDSTVPQRPTPAGVCAFTTSGGFVGIFFAPAMCGHDAAFPAPIDAS